MYQVLMDVVKLFVMSIMTDGWTILFRQAVKFCYLVLGVLKSSQFAQPSGARGGRIVDDLSNAASSAGQDRSFDVPTLRETLVNVALYSSGEFGFQQIVEAALNCRVYRIHRSRFDDFLKAVLAGIHCEGEEGGQWIAFAVYELVGGGRFFLRVTQTGGQGRHQLPLRGITSLASNWTCGGSLI